MELLSRKNRLLAVVIFAFFFLIIGAFSHIVYAWVSPSLVPPGGNITGSLSTGLGNQTKSSGNINLGGGGSLYAGGLVAAPNLCIGADCRTTWPSSVGDNLGNHTATMNLNLSGNDIVNVNTLNVARLCLNGDCRVSWP